MKISETTREILNQILEVEAGKDIYSMFIRGRASKAAAFRVANAQGFVTHSKYSTQDCKIWVRTDKPASELNENPEKKTRAKRGPNRRRFLNAAKKGLLQAKCNYRYTDDYAWDAATDFGKTDWFDVVLGENLREDHFSGTCGGVYESGDDIFTLRVHSNLSYSIRIKE